MKAKSAGNVIGGLRPREAALFLGLSPATLQRWRRLNQGPPFVRVSPRAVVYDRVSLTVFLSSCPRGGGRPVVTTRHPAAAGPLVA